MSRNNTREKILDAAETIFLEKGYEAASVKMILTESGAVAGSFYHFFSSKEELFEQVISRFMDRHQEKVKAVFESDEKLGEMLKEVLVIYGESLAQYAGMMKSGGMHWTVQEALHNRTVKAMIPPLANALKRMRGNHEIEFAMDADEEVMAALLVHGAESVLHAGKKADEDSQREQIQSFVRLIIHEL